MTAVPAKLQRCETGWRYEVGEVRGWNLTKRGAKEQIRKMKEHAAAEKRYFSHPAVWPDDKERTWKASSTCQKAIINMWGDELLSNSGGLPEAELIAAVAKQALKDAIEPSVMQMVVKEDRSWVESLISTPIEGSMLSREQMEELRAVLKVSAEQYLDGKEFERHCELLNVEAWRLRLQAARIIQHFSA